MIVRINNEPAGGFMDKVNEFADKFIDKEIEILTKPVEGLAESVADSILAKLSDGAAALLSLLNSYSPEIITLGVVACAFGFMLGPIWNGGATKWSGRLFVTILVGVVWRMILL
jgi:hypothetical protein